jgi:hypothetical protein
LAQESDDLAIRVCEQPPRMQATAVMMPVDAMDAKMNAMDIDDMSTNAGSAESSPAGVEARAPVAKVLVGVEMTPEAEFKAALQRLDAEFEGPAPPALTTFHAYPGNAAGLANAGQPAPLRKRSEDLPEAMMELDGEFLQ